MANENASSRALVAVTEISPPSTSIGALLGSIRPAWQAKSLIERVHRLLPVDPSSACQRLLNAAFHDLRKKVILAGLDIAGQAASLHGLPAVSKPEDVENYSNSRIIDLSYRMGLLTRSEWRRVKRCYEIRRDLEHEDDEYEAEIEDCFYIFKTCIDVILSRDPVELLKVTDVKEVVEQPKPQFPEEQFLEDYRTAPEPRQLEIQRFLVSTALDVKKPDVVRSNSVEMLKHLEPATRDSVKIELGGEIQSRVGRAVIDIATMKVANAAGVTPYLKRRNRDAYYTDLLQRLKAIGHEWGQYEHHGQILGELEDVGGLAHCHSDELTLDLLRWLVLCYIGEPGGYGNFGRNRAVFYSNSGAPIVKRIVKRCSARDLGFLKELADDLEVKAAMGRNKAVAERYEGLVDLAGDV